MKTDHVFLSQIVARAEKLPVNKNDRFWTDAVEYIARASKPGQYPDFLVSWAKEVVSSIRKSDTAEIFLVNTEPGCWGIFIAGAEDYAFSFNENGKIYLSRRFYEHIKNVNAVDMLAGILLHETTELILGARMEKKGVPPDFNKNHGEAVRMEKALLGEGKRSKTGLGDLYLDLVKLELSRRKVNLDKKDVFVNECSVAGEEIIAEINSTEPNGESFIVQLFPGQKKQIPYAKGVFAIKAEEFRDLFELGNIDFKAYCGLMKLMDDLFVEETVFCGKGPLWDWLSYIRALDISNEADNRLLNVLYLFTEKFFKTGIARREFVYNMFLLAGEYFLYFTAKKNIRENCWGKGQGVKDGIKSILDDLREGPRHPGLRIQLYDRAWQKNTLVKWFSEMSSVPSFADSGSIKCLQKIPKEISKYYPKKTDSFNMQKLDTDNELSMHEEILGIVRALNNLTLEPRFYHNAKIGGDPRFVELGMLRTHFWKGRNVFNREDTVGVWNEDGKILGFGEVTAVSESSVSVFMKDSGLEFKDKGYIKKAEKEDLSVQVSLDAVKKIRSGREIPLSLRENTPGVNPWGSMPAEEIVFFNHLINGDQSQRDAVIRAVSGEDVILIQGPPGSGKTTVIVEIALQFMNLGKRVLLSSQTNNAVDNALQGILKWKREFMGAARVASAEEKISDENIKSIWVKSLDKLSVFEDAHNAHKKGYVVGATNVGSHTLSSMKGREFDVLIMDEAGKSNLVESVLPMLLVKKGGRFVIVGDHKQGKPFEYEEDVLDLFIDREMELGKKTDAPRTRRSVARDALKETLNQSLFERLIKSGRKSVLLSVNYRSHPKIVELVSKLFYDGKIVPSKSHPGQGKGIVIVDTSRDADISERKETEVVSEEHGAAGRGYKNVYEAGLVVNELRELARHRYLTTGVKTKHITGVTILAPYVFQVDEIRKQISQKIGRSMPSEVLNDLLDNVSTIDSFQGREDDIIIISFTRSNTVEKGVGFLGELNRINVALSRAKRKMVLIGDFKMLKNVQRGQNPAYIRNIFRRISEA